MVLPEREAASAARKLVESIGRPDLILSATVLSGGCWCCLFRPTGNEEVVRVDCESGEARLVEH